MKWRFRAGLFFLTLAAYANSFHLGLAQDSAWIIARDPRILAATTANIGLIFAKHYWWPIPFGNLYRPLTTASLLFNYAILGNGPDPAGYHVVNFLMHLVNVWLVYELSLLILRSRWPAFFTAALWGVHPVGVESVTNIVGRADLLAAMSIFAGLLLYAHRSSQPGRNRYGPALLLGVIAIAGVFSKESAVVLLGLMFLWDASFAANGLKKQFLQNWPYYATVAASVILLFAVRIAVLGGVPALPKYMADNPLWGASFWTARLTAIKVIGFDLWLLLFPLRLSADRSYDQIPLASLSDPAAWLALLALAIVLVLVLWLFRRDRLWFWCAGFFVIALLPTSNLLFPIGAIMAERFLYLPSLGLVMAMVGLLYRVPNRRLGAGILTALVLIGAARTALRNPAWDSDLALATADLQAAPQSARLHDMLALALFTRDAQHNIDRVIVEQTRSCDILSSLPPERSSDRPLAYLGMYSLFKADIVSGAESNYWREKALSVLIRARTLSQIAEKAYDDDQRANGTRLQARLAYAMLYFTLGDVYSQLGRYPEAVDSLRYAQGIDPEGLNAYDGLAAAYLAMGNPNLAVVALEQKAVIDGSQPKTLAAISEIYRKIPEASCAFSQRGTAWQLNPACPRVKRDLCLAYAGLAQAWQDARRPEQAVELAATSRQLGCN